MEVLVSVHVKVVERVPVRWMAIAKSEVNSNVELDFAASKHILKEGVALVEVQGLKSDGPIFALVEGVLSLVLFELRNIAS